MLPSQSQTAIEEPCCLGRIFLTHSCQCGCVWGRAGRQMLQAHPEPLQPQGPEAAPFLLAVPEEPALGAALLGWGCSGVLSADTDFSPEDPSTVAARTGGGGPGAREGSGQR